MISFLVLVRCLGAEESRTAGMRKAVSQLQDCYTSKQPAHVILLTPVANDPIVQYDERICAVYSPRYKQRDLFIQNWQQTVYFKDRPMDKNLIRNFI